MSQLITLPGSFSKIVTDGATIARVNYRTDGLCECRQSGVSVLMSPEKATHWLASIAMAVVIESLS